MKKKITMLTLKRCPNTPRRSAFSATVGSARTWQDYARFG